MQFKEIPVGCMSASWCQLGSFSGDYTIWPLEMNTNRSLHHTLWKVWLKDNSTGKASRAIWYVCEMHDYLLLSEFEAIGRSEVEISTATDRYYNREGMFKWEM